MLPGIPDGAAKAVFDESPTKAVIKSVSERAKRSHLAMRTPVDPLKPWHEEYILVSLL